MYTELYSAGLVGVDGYSIRIEVNISNGMTKFEVVGLPDQAVSEARERVIAAITNSDAYFPSQRVIINLSPADIRKTGSLYDLSFAIGVLISSNQMRPKISLKDTVIFGEVALDGGVERIKGLFPMLLSSFEDGKKNAIIPYSNLEEAKIIDGMNIYPVKSLRDAIDVVNGETPCIEISSNFEDNLDNEYLVDFSEVKGQHLAKRAAMICAAGGHNFMMIGPPGCGKTLIAERLNTILPKLTFEEAVETTKIYSSVGELPSDTPLINKRPFRKPHHTASYSSIVGGGHIPKPGEVSFSHNGILFLDEFTEFDKNVLQTLREPMEEKEIRISRAMASVNFPANFILVGAMNPCECGYFGDEDSKCTCSDISRKRYYSKISGPILDRVDIVVELRRLDYAALRSEKVDETSTTMRDKVQVARDRQINRFSDAKNVYSNGMMSPKDTREHCKLDDEGERLLKMAIDKFGITGRGYDKILRVSRTIADLELSDVIKSSHIAESIQYRGISIFNDLISA